MGEYIEFQSIYAPTSRTPTDTVTRLNDVEDKDERRLSASSVRKSVLLKRGMLVFVKQTSDESVTSNEDVPQDNDDDDDDENEERKTSIDSGRPASSSYEDDQQRMHASTHGEDKKLRSVKSRGTLIRSIGRNVAALIKRESDEMQQLQYSSASSSDASSVNPSPSRRSDLRKTDSLARKNMLKRTGSHASIVLPSMLFSSTECDTFQFSDPNRELPEDDGEVPDEPRSLDSSSAAHPVLVKSAPKRSVLGSLSVFQALSFTKEVSDAAKPMTSEMIRVGNVIQKHRQALIQGLLVETGDIIMKIRFVSAVDQVDNTDDRDERKRLGLKVIQTFALPSSMFKISLSEDMSRRILNSGVGALWEARTEALADLSLNEQVMRVVEALEDHNAL